MVTAEVCAGYLLLVLLGARLGITPQALVAIPPLNGLAAIGAAGAFVAELMAFILTFAAFSQAVLYVAAIAGWLRGDGGREHVRRFLADGRLDTGIRPMLWAVLAGFPVVIAVAFIVTAPRRPAELVFVISLVAVAAAETMPPFGLADVWRGLRGLGAAAREMARPPTEESARRPAGRVAAAAVQPADGSVPQMLDGFIAAEPRTRQ